VTDGCVINCAHSFIIIIIDDPPNEITQKYPNEIHQIEPHKSGANEHHSLTRREPIEYRIRPGSSLNCHDDNHGIIKTSKHVDRDENWLSKHKLMIDQEQLEKHRNDDERVNGVVGDGIEERLKFHGNHEIEVMQGDNPEHRGHVEGAGKCKGIELVKVELEFSVATSGGLGKLEEISSEWERAENYDEELKNVKKLII
jgi:hypothetical protein